MGITEMARWIFCGGMARSGSTLQFQIASELVERLGAGRRAGWYAGGNLAQAKRDHADTEGLLVFKAHRLTPAIQAEVQAQGGFVLCTHRDIRDVTASWMRMNDRNFSMVWHGGLLQKWTERFDEWAALPDAYVTHYSALKEDLAGEVRRVAQFLGLPASQSLVDSIAEDLSPQRQAERIARQKLAPDQRMDPHTLLHDKHISHTSEGDYTRSLRTHEVDLIERHCAEWMALRGYPARSPRLGLLDRWRQRRLGPPGVRKERELPRVAEA